jgi:hypothetical protein
VGRGSTTGGRVEGAEGARTARAWRSRLGAARACVRPAPTPAQRALVCGLPRGPCAENGP